MERMRMERMERMERTDLAALGNQGLGVFFSLTLLDMTCRASDDLDRSDMQFSWFKCLEGCLQNHANTNLWGAED